MDNNCTEETEETESPSVSIMITEIHYIDKSLMC